MDKRGKVTYAMVEVAIDRAIRDIEENPTRGIRNLVWLLAHLSTGQFLQNFLNTIRQMLTNQNSPYYYLTRHVVRNVDHRLLGILVCVWVIIV